jgi:hypothetical protein
MSLLNHFDHSYLQEKTIGELKYKDIFRSKKKRLLEYKDLLNKFEENQK